MGVEGRMARWFGVRKGLVEEDPFVARSAARRSRVSVIPGSWRVIRNDPNKSTDHPGNPNTTEAILLR